MIGDRHSFARRQRLLASGLAMTWLIVWLQVFLPFMAPVDPLNPGRHIFGDSAIICTIEGMKIVKLSDLPVQEDGKSGKTAGAGTHACPLCAATTIAQSAVLPVVIEFALPLIVAEARFEAVATQPRAPPRHFSFAARAPPSLS